VAELAGSIVGGQITDSDGCPLLHAARTAVYITCGKFYSIRLTNYIADHPTASAIRN